jgi:hypothetical protein
MYPIAVDGFSFAAVNFHSGLKISHFAAGLSAQHAELAGLVISRLAQRDNYPKLRIKWEIMGQSRAIS